MVYKSPYKKGFKRSPIKPYMKRKFSSVSKYKKPYKRFTKYSKGKSFKKSYGSRITFPQQEKYLRSRVVSRKFKMILDAACGPNMQKSGIDKIASVMKSKKLLGHITEYEEFAISYVKIKTKMVNARCLSYINDNSRIKTGIAYQKDSSVNMDMVMQKIDFGNALVTRKQNLLAAHKKARTNPWVKTKDYIEDPEDMRDTLFPTYPTLEIVGLNGTVGYYSCEISVYVVTKNKLVETTNLRTEVVERLIDTIEIATQKPGEPQITIDGLDNPPSVGQTAADIYYEQKYQNKFAEEKARLEQEAQNYVQQQTGGLVNN